MPKMKFDDLVPAVQDKIKEQIDAFNPNVNHITFYDLWTANAPKLIKCFPAQTVGGYDASRADYDLARKLIVMFPYCTHDELERYMCASNLFRPKWDTGYLKNVVKDIFIIYNSPPEAPMAINEIKNDDLDSEPVVGVPPVPAEKFSHYKKDVRHLVMIDVYRVLDLFGVTDQAIGHAVKKLLCAGVRGGKDREQDYREAVASINRALQMIAENDNKSPSGRGVIHDALK